MRETAKARVWTRRVVRFQRSGLGRKAWCTREGIHPSTLDYWRRLVGDPATPARKVRRSKALVPIVVREAAPFATALSSPLIEVALPGSVRVRAGSGVDVTWLATLLRAMAPC